MGLEPRRFFTSMIGWAEEKTCILVCGREAAANVYKTVVDSRQGAVPSCWAFG